ncbi:universal stress protein [Soehngenia saccharolytica]|nr:universal stress protein [Soehngenia saccharolytica]
MEKENKKRVILVGMDESEESVHALQWALSHLSSHQDRLIIIHVQPTGSSKAKALASYSLVSFAALDTLKIFEEDIKRTTRKLFATAMEKCNEKHVVPETKAVNGVAKDVLCNAIKDCNADMLVLGSHGNGPIKRLLFGSVSEHCVRHAHCPVIVVKNH